MPEFVSAICALLLLILVSAFVVSKPFRDAVLGGPGSAKVLGIFTVQGVAIVLLCVLFIGGLLYPLEYHQPEAVVLTETEKANLADLDRLLEQQKRSDLYR